jgi:hypothetical protein
MFGLSSVHRLMVTWEGWSGDVNTRLQQQQQQLMRSEEGLAAAVRPQVA